MELKLTISHFVESGRNKSLYLRTYSLVCSSSSK